MILEVVVWLTTIMAANILIRPIARRLKAPGWLERLRNTPRGRMLLRVWMVVLLVMIILWFIGDQPQPWRWILWALWIAVPLTGLRVTAFLLRR